MTEARPIRQLDVDQAAAELGVGTTGAPPPEAASAAADVGTPLLVDVREADELTALRVPGALHVPLSDFATTSADLPRDRPLLLLCASGRRSLVAAEYLQRNGHRDVANVSGGIIEWQKRGLPTANGPVTPGQGGADGRAARAGSRSRTPRRPGRGSGRD